jgi:hypothetical protein
MEFVNKIPNWLRWILIPIASILAMFLVHWITQFFAGVQSSQVGSETGGFFDNIFRNTLPPAFTGFATVYAGVLMAPQGKKVTSLILAAIYILMLSITLLSGLEVGDFWKIVNVIFTIIGVGAGVYTAFEEKYDQ